MLNQEEKNGDPNDSLTRRNLEDLKFQSNDEKTRSENERMKSPKITIEIEKANQTAVFVAALIVLAIGILVIQLVDSKGNLDAHSKENEILKQEIEKQLAKVETLKGCESRVMQLQMEFDVVKTESERLNFKMKEFEEEHRTFLEREKEVYKLQAELQFLHKENEACKNQMNKLGTKIDRHSNDQSQCLKIKSENYYFQKENSVLKDRNADLEITNKIWIQKVEDLNSELRQLLYNENSNQKRKSNEFDLCISACNVIKSAASTAAGFITGGPLRLN